LTPAGGAASVHHHLQFWLRKSKYVKALIASAGPVVNEVGVYHLPATGDQPVLSGAAHMWPSLLRARSYL